MKSIIKLDAETLLIASIDAGGNLVLTDKPATGRRKRGVQPRTLSVDIREIWNRGGAPDESWADSIIKDMPVADFSGPPEKVGYRAKVWLLAKLRAQKEVGCGGA